MPAWLLYASSVKSTYKAKTSFSRHFDTSFTKTKSSAMKRSIDFDCPIFCARLPKFYRGSIEIQFDCVRLTMSIGFSAFPKVERSTRQTVIQSKREFYPMHERPDQLQNKRVYSGSGFACQRVEKVYRS